MTRTALRTVVEGWLHLAPAINHGPDQATLNALNQYEANWDTLLAMQVGDPGATALIKQMCTFLQRVWESGHPISGRVVHSEKTDIHNETMRIMGADAANLLIVLNDGLA